MTLNDFTKAWHETLSPEVKQLESYREGRLNWIPAAVWESVQNQPDKEERLKSILERQQSVSETNEAL